MKLIIVNRNINIGQSPLAIINPDITKGIHDLCIDVVIGGSNQISLIF
jgi:hypothetical protein